MDVKLKDGVNNIATPPDDAGPRNRKKVDLEKEVYPGTKPIAETIDYSSGYADSVYERFLLQFRLRMHDGWEGWRRNWNNAREDLDFAYRQQWPDQDIERRIKDKRPTLEINLLPQYIHHVVGQVRQSKFSIMVRQKGTITDRIPMYSDPNNELSYSDIMSGLVKDIEQRSDAPYLYSRAAQHAVEGGFGWLYVRTLRPVDDPRNIELRIEHVQDRFSVMFDPYVEDTNYQDAEWAAISKQMNIREFRSRYPEHAGGVSANVGAVTNHNGWESVEANFATWWGGQNTVRVTDYFYFDPVTRYALTYRDPDGKELWGYRRDIGHLHDELKTRGYELVEEKKVETKQLMYCRLLANAVLEEPQEYPSTIIPIIPVLGRVVDLGSHERLLLSLIRHAKDPQRMLNTFQTAAVEAIQDRPKQPFLAAAESIKNYQEEWKNIKKPDAVLPYEHIEGVPPPQRIMQGNRAVGEMEMVALARDMVMDTTGIHESERGIRSNETSGLAISRRQEAGSLSTYEFVDNLAHSVGRLGDLLCEMIPRIYKGVQLKKIILPDDSEGIVHLDHKIKPKGEEGEETPEFSITHLLLARYYCTCSAGASSVSEKQKFLDMMTELGKTNPQIFSSCMDKIFENIDVPGSKAIARRMKRMIPPQVLTEEEREGMPPQEPTPDQQVEMAKSQAGMAQAQAEMEIHKMRMEIEGLKLKGQIAKLDGEMQQQGSRDEGASDADLEGRIKAMIKEVLSDERSNA